MSHQSSISRRRFLLSGGAALALPTLMRASALGKDGATAPSNRIPMAFVGLGGQGGGHLFGGGWTYLPSGYLARRDVQVVGVCDIQHRRAEAARARVEQHYAGPSGGHYSGCAAHYDIREVLDRSDVDAVLIAVAYHCQGVLATMAARAGKDVYCEKPTSITIRWSRALVEAFRATGRVYQAGTQQRSEYDDRFFRAVSLVRSGAIGKLKRVYAYQIGGGFEPPPRGDGKRVAPPDVNWEAYVGPLPWFTYDGNCGAHRFAWGDINWGQHHYDIVQWGLGTDDTGPLEIRLENKKPVYRYASGVEVYGCPPPGEVWKQGGACFIGDAGRITVHRDILTSDPPGILKQPTPHVPGLYHSTSHSGNFLECVRTRQRTICDPETAHRANSVLLLGGIAGRLGRTLRWDPVREEFPGDAEANRLLGLAARPPWLV